MDVNELVNQMNAKLEEWQEWLAHFFATIDTYEMIAVGGVALGFVFFVAGIVFMI